MGDPEKSTIVGGLVLCCLIVGWRGAPVTAQSVIVVPTQSATIQAAINSAQSGDTIVVEPGTYFESIDYLGKDLGVVSVGGAAVTVIDGSQTATVCRMSSTTNGRSILSGFTIRNGRGADGTDVIGSGNGGDGHAGGIEVAAGATVTIRRCRIVGNRGGRGGHTPLGNSGNGGVGGVLLSGRSTFADCVVSGNFGGAGGDAVLASGPAPLIVIGARPGSGGVGGVQCLFGPWLLDRLSIVNNVGGASGIKYSTLILTGAYGGGTGGIVIPAHYASFTTPFSPTILDESIIDGNQGGIATYPATRPGHGGVECDNTQIRSTSITRNVGGDISVPNPIPTGLRGGVGGVRFASAVSGPTAGTYSLVHTTIADNDGGRVLGTTAMTGPGGVNIVGTCALSHSIVWGNDNGNGNQSSVVVNSGSTLLAAESTVEGGFSGVGVSSANPQFSDDSVGDFSLKLNSPCLDHLPSIAFANQTARDVRGHPRIVGNAADVGAIESLNFPVMLGSDDDVVQEIRIDGIGEPYQGVRSVVGGSSIDMTVVSPRSEFAGAAPVILAEALAFGSSTMPIFGYPELWVDQNLVVAYDGSAFGVSIGAAFSIGFATPIGLSGIIVRLQTIAFGPSARNGLFGATDAQDLRFN